MQQYNHDLISVMISRASCVRPAKILCRAQEC